MGIIDVYNVLDNLTPLLIIYSISLSLITFAKCFVFLPCLSCVIAVYLCVFIRIFNFMILLQHRKKKKKKKKEQIDSGVEDDAGGGKLTGNVQGSHQDEAI